MDLNIKAWVVQKDRDTVVFVKSEDSMNSLWRKILPHGSSCLYRVAPFAMTSPDQNNLKGAGWDPRWQKREGTTMFHYLH